MSRVLTLKETVDNFAAHYNLSVIDFQGEIPNDPPSLILRKVVKKEKYYLVVQSTMMRHVIPLSKRKIDELQLPSFVYSALGMKMVTE